MFSSWNTWCSRPHANRYSLVSWWGHSLGYPLTIQCLNTMSLECGRNLFEFGIWAHANANRLLFDWFIGSKACRSILILILWLIQIEMLSPTTPKAHFSRVAVSIKTSHWLCVSLACSPLVTSGLGPEWKLLDLISDHLWCIFCQQAHKPCGFWW